MIATTSSAHPVPSDRSAHGPLNWAWTPRAVLRLRLASAYDGLLARPPRHAGALTATIPVRHTAVAGARPELAAVAARLRARPAPPRAGVRAARRLLVDGAGPLYVGSEDDALRTAAREVLAQLDA